MIGLQVEYRHARHVLRGLSCLPACSQHVGKGWWQPLTGTKRVREELYTLPTLRCLATRQASARIAEVTPACGPQPRKFVRNRSCSLRQQRRIRCPAHGDVTPAELVDSTSQGFLHEALRPDGRVNLGKACLLLALEEQAAWGAWMTQYWTMEGAPQDVKRTFRSTATASTWSLERLDGIAAEAATLFRQKVGLLAEGALVTSAATKYPMQLVEAVNTVLFERQGYYNSKRFGDTRDLDFSQVLETGQGSAAVICILYCEITSRLGLHLSTYILDGSYLVLGTEPPEQFSLQGEPLMVDAFGGGTVFTRKEVCELFGMEEVDLHPASQQEVLASLLKSLRDCHWAKGVGCRPEPALMTPLSLDTALCGDVRITGTNFHMKRACAAAEKARQLLPDCRHTQLDAALLLYFDGRWEDAWLELGVVAEKLRKQGAEQGQAAGSEELQVAESGGSILDLVSKVEMVMEKTRLLIEFSQIRA